MDVRMFMFLAGTCCCLFFEMMCNYWRPRRHWKLASRFFSCGLRKQTIWEERMRNYSEALKKVGCPLVYANTWPLFCSVIHSPEVPKKWDETHGGRHRTTIPNIAIQIEIPILTTIPETPTNPPLEAWKLVGRPHSWKPWSQVWAAVPKPETDKRSIVW